MKPQPRLQDMPFPIQRRIADHLDFYVDKMSLRSACPNFRPIIGDPEAQCNLEVRGFSTGVFISLKINDHLKQKRIYDKTDKGCQVLIKHDRLWTFEQRERDAQKAGDREILMENEEFMEVAKKDFEMIVDNPNLSIDEFSLEKDSQVNLAGLLKCKLKVKNFRVDGFKATDHAELHQILSYLDSDSLETFDLCNELESLDPKILQQWKNLKRLVMSHNGHLSIDVWWNYPDTELHLTHLKLNDLTTILEHFQDISEAPRFEISVIYTKLQDQEIKAVLERSGVQFRRTRGYQCALPIPDNENKRSLHLYVEDGTVMFAQELI